MLVFVFGTLKEGFPNFAANRGRRVGGKYRTEDRFPLYLVGARNSPWLLDLPSQGNLIIGELYEVDEAVLRDMDVLERVHEPDGYIRRRIFVVPEGESLQKRVEAQIYLKDPAALLPQDIQVGPLVEYKLEHAALYQPRASSE